MSMQGAYAGPTGEQIVGGEGRIVRPDGTTTNIHQNTHRIVINWDSFNVAPNEVVNFYQPSSDAAALNRIFDQNPSEIFGAINANGRVLLVNPNGMIFGQSASVNVGALVASGLDINPDAFMAGDLRFENANGAMGGLVVNHGLLQAATGGSVSLFGGGVLNTGVIVANYGTVNLAAGEQVTIDFDGDGLINFAVDGELLENAYGIDAAVANEGSIRADSGRVLLSANAANNVFAQVVNNSGVIAAKGIATDGGRVFLTGSGGDTFNSGVIDVSSAEGEGGTVHVLGDRVALIEDATIDASGAKGGGTVLVGGDYQGSNPDIHNAARTYVGSDVVIDASATDAGDGGEVIVWSDEITRFYGEIIARGAGGGNGGFAEVSGFKLDFNGFADLSGAKAGTLLLDPKDIIVQVGGAENELDGQGPSDDGDSNTYSFTEDGTNTETLDVVALTTIMNGGTTVTLQAHDDITIDAIIDTASAATAGGGLTLQAGDDIFINANISTNNGAITFTANDAAATPVAPDATGDIFMADGVTIDSGSAAIVLGAENLMLENLVTTGTIDVTATAGSILQTSADMQLAGSTITLAAATGIGASGAAINTAATSLDLTGTAGDVFVSEADGVTLDAVSAGGAVDISNAAGMITVGGATTAGTTLDLAAVDGITVNAAVTSGGVTGINADSNNDGAGTFAAGATGSVNTNGNALAITASDVDINATATLNSGAAGTTITASLDGDLSVGTQQAAELNVTNAELANITASSIDFVTTNTGDIYLDGAIGVAANGDISLTSGDTVIVQSAGASVANALSVTGATTLNGGVSSSTGDITFNNDITAGANVDVLAGGSITVAGVNAGAFAVNLRVDNDNDSAESLTLTGALTGDVNLSGSATSADDTLIGGDVANLWNITGADIGTLNGSDFADFANLAGGSGDDAFTVGSGATLSGTIDGGEGAETGGDTLAQTDGANSWTITGVDAGSVTDIGSFANIESVSGGTGVDTFDFDSGAAINAAGGAGDDIFNLDVAVVGALDGGDDNDTFNAQGGTATSVTGGGTGTDSDTVVGSGAIAISGVDQITSNGQVFTDIENVTGSANDDAFTIASGATLSGTIDGGEGGETTGDTLAQTDGANSWTISGANAGDVTDIGSFANIESVTGGTGVDTFDFDTNAAINAAGGAGNDIFNLDVAVTGNLDGGADDDTFN
ncbi:MAG TPA: filamentous hemagglutinin N-terminal domain-containing protein, partial [Gammaproteobacteria bacterium]